MYAGLRENEHGRCAFRCEVDQVDHQIVQMNFKNGVKASLKMICGAVPATRRITFYGSMGEITMDDRTGEITVMPFGREPYSIRIDVNDGHGGGDDIIVNALYDILSDKIEPETPLSESLECHLIGIAAEESRKLGGALVKVHMQ